MDSLTQAVLGAGLQGALLGRFHGRKALAAGAILATLPDLDVFLDHGDPISNMIHHRGFSHSLLVLTTLAAVLTWLYRRWRPNPEYSAGLLFLTLWLVLCTHPLLDAFTSYGTQLWWPLRPVPTSWSSIFIIDPFFTLPLTVAVIAAAVMGSRPRILKALSWTLIWCALYLMLSVGIKTIMEARVQRMLSQQGIHVQSMFSTPQPFTIFLWRVVARTDDDHYVEAISSVFDRRQPEYIRLPLHTNLARAFLDGQHSSGQAQDQRGAQKTDAALAGLQWFTGNWLRYDDIDGKLVATDLRMGLGVGYYSFRFMVAERADSNSAWQPLTPQSWPRQRGLDQLRVVMRRIWQQTPPLPLSQWEKAM